MAEWSKAAVSKTVNGVTRSGVRIPFSPPFSRSWKFAGEATSKQRFISFKSEFFFLSSWRSSGGTLPIIEIKRKAC